MNISFITAPFDSKHAPYIAYIRHKVFTVEQDIDASEDLDGQDPDSIHVLAKAGNHFIGTGRMMLDGHIGRLAVISDFRNKKIGSNIVLTLINEARNRQLKSVYLGAQCSARNFYQKLGFIEYGKIFLEVDIDHIMMKKIIY